MKKNEFLEKLKTEVFPKISVYDKKRNLFLFIFVFITIIACIALCFIFFSTIYKALLTTELGIYLIVFLFLLPGLSYNLLKKYIANRINTLVMKLICGAFGTFEWKQDSTKRDKCYRNALVVPNSGLVFHDDGFWGTYKDVNIVIDEVVYKEKIKAKYGYFYIPFFKALVIEFNFNKNFKSHTVIKNNSLFHFKPAKKLKHTVLEDVEFEKKYDVFTNDEVEARFLITTAFMERLNNMKMSFKCSNIICSFYKKSLYVSLKTNKDMFSMGSLFKSVLDEKQYIEVFDELYSVLSIVDVLKLNQKIGL